MTYQENFKAMIKQFENGDSIKCSITRGQTNACNTCPIETGCYGIKADSDFIVILTKRVNKKDLLEEILQ